MGKILGFRCKQCRAELLAMPEPGGVNPRTGWTPPVLCCERPLRALEPDQILPSMLTLPGVARCPRCGYSVRLIVHPAASLVCMPCRKDFVIFGGNADQGDQAKAPVAPTPDVWGWG
jgi:DNA-directed RNA polymerase subunit RPC12/RpoP